MGRLLQAAIGLSTVGAAYARARRHRSLSLSKAVEQPGITGSVKPGYEAVRDAFAENFLHRRELGAACCIYHKGEKVVDLWGGIRDRLSGDPWEADTMVLVYSATKGLAAMAVALAHSRGLLDYDELVCTYWPEFAQHRKDKITVRQLLAHQAGLFAFNETVDHDVVADPDRLARVMERQTPEWKPGSRQAYHAISLGFYESELIRRIDPQHRTLGQYFQDEIATPLGLEFYIRLPESIPDSRLAPLEGPSMWSMFTSVDMLRMMLASFNHRSLIYRALSVNPGSELARDPEHIYARNLEIPSGGGVGAASAIAHAYSVFATDGRELNLRPETLKELAAPPSPPKHGFYDECMKAEVRFSLGFMKPCSTWQFGHESSFGSPGAGGSMGFADPQARIGYGYVTNTMGVKLTGDPRDLALRKALYTLTPASDGNVQF